MFALSAVSSDSCCACSRPKADGSSPRRQNYVPARHELGASRGCRGVRDQCLGPADGVEMTILVVQWLIGKEELCHLAVDLPFDLEMDMWRPHVASSRRIRSGLDRRESVP